MVGISAWGDYSIFHGLGVEVEARTIFADKPTPVARSGQKLYGDGLKETMAQGGIIYKYHPIFKIRPFVKAVGGIGRVQFPSLNPLYTHEISAIYSADGGLEYRAWNTVFVRAEYEYQWWKDFRSGSVSLNPSGFTVGATYYLRGVHRHY